MPFTRRTLLGHGALLTVASRVRAAQPGSTVETSSGKIRGAIIEDIHVFKGIPYGASTAGVNRFKPPVKTDAWTGVRDALAFGASAPQSLEPEAQAIREDENCLVLNVFTPSVAGGKRPVMVWLHGGGFSQGSGSGRVANGTNLPRESDVVVVTINHRLNALGFTYLAEAAGPEFAESGAVGMLDIVAALRWVRENIANFGGDPNLVTIFGQSGGGRKVATLMSMPSAKGLFHRAIIQSGALLRLTTPEVGVKTTELLLAELGLKRDQARQLQAVPIPRLLAANAAVQKTMYDPVRNPGTTANSPAVDGKILPRHPWDPTAPSISATVPLLVGWNRTEETAYDVPTPEKLGLDEAGLRTRVKARIGGDPEALIRDFRQAHPQATPWDLWILIATDHPRGAYAREVARRKAALPGAAAYVYRFDWETPEGGGHMRSPHSVEVPFVFRNIAAAGPLISKMPEAHALAVKVSAAWAAFARTGDPNASGLPRWAPYSAQTRPTMLLNNDSRVEADPDRIARLAMDRVLELES